MTLSPRHLDQALRLAFFGALAVMLVVTMIPMPPPPVQHGDKVEHFVAFYVLTLLGAAAYRSHRSLIWLALGLVAYGGAIEILQGFSFVGRSRDLADWVSDSLGVGLAMAPMAIANWRRRTQPQ